MSDVDGLIRERTAAFAGRERVFRAIDDWLQHSTAERVFLLTGGPGTGKTAIAARLVQMSRGDVDTGGLESLAPGTLTFFHFCQASNDTTLDALRFVERLSRELAGRFPPFRDALVNLGDRNITINATQTVTDAETVSNVVIHSLNIVNFSARQAFDHVVRKPLEALRASGFEAPIVALVDSMDEAFSYAAENVAALLGELTQPSQAMAVPIRFVVTSRPDPRVLKLFPKPALNLTAEAPADVDDVRTYVANRLRDVPVTRKETFLDKIAQASAGNFMYARYVLDDLLAGGAALTDADLEVLELPSDLQDQYRRFLDRELGKNDQLWASRYRPVLGLLAVAREPGLEARTIASATGLAPSTVDSALQTCAQYLAGTIPQGPLRIYHQSFRDFLVSPGSYTVFPGEAHAALADFFTSEYRNRWYSCEDAYALRHASAHLVQSLEAAGTRKERGRLADLLSMQLTDIGFLEMHARRGWVFDLIANFSQAMVRIPDDHPWQPMLDRLGELLRSDAQFVARHPQAFFQSLWNRGWWYDAPQAASFYAPSSGGGNRGPAAWSPAGEKLCALLERWRGEREKAGESAPWLRALRPPPDPLGSVQVAVFVGLGDESARLDVTPDERRLVCGFGEDAAGVRIYDLAGSGSVVHSRDFSDGEYLSALAMSPRGDAIAVALGDSSLRLLDPDRLDEIARLTDREESDGTDGLIGAVAFSPSGQFLVAGNWRGDLQAWDMDTRQQLPSVRAHDSKVTALAFADDGSEFASGGGDGPSQLRRWRLQQGLQSISAKNLEQQITCVVYAPGLPLRLACMLYSEEVMVLDAAGEQIRTLRIGDGEHSECGAFTPDGGSLLAGAGDVFSAAYVYCWDMKSGDMLWKLPGHNFMVQDLIIFDNGRRLVTAGDNTIRVWDLEKAARGSILNPLEPDIDHALFSHDGTIVCTASEKTETARARRLADGSLLHTWDGHEGGVHSVAVSPAARLACGCGSGAVKVWNLQDGSEWMTYSGHTDQVRALAFSADGRLLATGAQDGTAHLVDTVARKGIATFDHARRKKGWVNVVSFSPDGRLLLTGDFERMIVWDLATRKKRLTFKGKLSTYYGACFTDDARDVVVQGVGSELTAWELETGQPVPLRDVHRQAMDKVKMRAGPWTWDEPQDPDHNRREPPELVIRRRDTKAPVGWLQIPYGEILHHPGGDIWGVRRGGHLHIFALEQR